MKKLELISENLMSHNRVKCLKTGCFQTKYIKLEFTKGTPISINSIKIFGIPQEMQTDFKDPVMGELDSRSPQKLINDKFSKQILVSNPNMVLYS